MARSVNAAWPLALVLIREGPVQRAAARRYCGVHRNVVLTDVVPALILRAGPQAASGIPPRSGPCWKAVLSAQAGSAAPAVRVIAALVALTKPLAEKMSVRDPTTPVIARSLKLATPLALVVAVVVPLRAPPPDRMDALTTTPGWFTGLLLASRSWITGC